MSDTDGASLPLQGKRILVTRTQQQAGTLRDRLAVLGATPIVFPTIRIVPPANWETLDAAFARLFLKDEARHKPVLPTTLSLTQSPRLRPSVRQDERRTSDERYSWLIFTSANAVNICCERLLHLGYDLHRLREVPIATIGPATAAALTRYGLTAQLIPDEYIAEGVADALLKDTQQRGESLVGKRILLPRAAEARKVLVHELQQAGAIVDEIAAYATLPVASNDALGRDVLHLLQTHQIDIITFTSSSTVRNFVQWLTSCTEGEPDSVQEADRHELTRVDFSSGEQLSPSSGRPQGPQPHVPATPAPTRTSLAGHFQDNLPVQDSHKGGHYRLEGVGNQVAQDVVTPLVGVRSLITSNTQVKIACIGPITAQTARECGLPVHIEAKEFTIDGLVEAIVQDEKLNA